MGVGVRCESDWRVRIKPDEAGPTVEGVKTLLGGEDKGRVEESRVQPRAAPETPAAGE